MSEMKEICESILKHRNNKDHMLVGIDGLGGAGKSTITEALSQYLKGRNVPVLILHIDDFIHPRSFRYNDRFPKWQCYYEFQWRYAYLKQDVLKKVREIRKGTIEIELYEKEQDTYSIAEYKILPQTVVLVQAIFLQRKELKDCFDYMIYIDVPEDVRLTRVLERDLYIGNREELLEKYEKRYFPAEHKYAEEYCPVEKAKYVLRK